MIVWKVIGIAAISGLLVAAMVVGAFAYQRKKRKGKQEREELIEFLREHYPFIQGEVHGGKSSHINEKGEEVVHYAWGTLAQDKKTDENAYNESPYEPKTDPETNSMKAAIAEFGYLPTWADYRRKISQERLEELFEEQRRRSAEIIEKTQKNGVDIESVRLKISAAMKRAYRRESRLARLTNKLLSNGADVLRAGDICPRRTNAEGQTVHGYGKTIVVIDMAIEKANEMSQSLTDEERAVKDIQLTLYPYPLKAGTDQDERA